MYRIFVIRLEHERPLTPCPSDISEGTSCIGSPVPNICHTTNMVARSGAKYLINYRFKEEIKKKRKTSKRKQKYLHKYHPGFLVSRQRLAYFVSVDRHPLCPVVLKRPKEETEVCFFVSSVRRPSQSIPVEESCTKACCFISFISSVRCPSQSVS